MLQLVTFLETNEATDRMLYLIINLAASRYNTWINVLDVKKIKYFHVD